MPETSATVPVAVGALLQYWRKARQLSQLALATQAQISSRHLCFVETGRANPSRDMVLLLADTLDVPLRERNALLLAAGFAPLYPESKLDAPALGAVRQALDAILRQQEPFPAVVMNRCWDVVQTNQAATRFFGFLLGEHAARAPSNVLKLFFHPELVKPFVGNWLAVAQSLVQRVHREALAGTLDEATRTVLAEVLSYPGVPATLRQPSPSAPSLVPVIPVSFEKSGQKFDFFSAITTLGTPQDITLQELRIECFFPSNDATAHAARELAAEPLG
jgi:transcriptional regulator with XRE-family HTH domain